MIPISWSQIRAWRGSKQEGFDELCCQLVREEPMPPNGRFTSIGKPDSGIECLWQLESGEEWGWQAKFFPDGFNNRWSQCDKSVRAALAGYPKLTRMYFCFPYKFPDGRKPNQRSGAQLWKEHKIKWTSWAKKLGMTVEFILWDETELVHRLSAPEHVGRVWFWFNAPALDDQWFARHVKGATAHANDRYTPDLHFEIPLAQRFDSLSRTQVFWARLRELGNTLGKATLQFNRYPLPGELAAHNDNIRRSLGLVLDVLNIQKEPSGIAMDYSKLLELTEAAREGLRDGLQQLWTRRDVLTSQFERQHGRRPSYAEIRDDGLVEPTLREIDASLAAVTQFCESVDAQLSANQFMLLSGNAGLGKTHLVCSVAEKRAMAALPTILLLGERFSDCEPWTNIMQLLGLSCSRDEFLGALNAAGQAAGCRALILIDAINEGLGMPFWKRHLASMLTDLEHFPWIALAITIRTDYIASDFLPLERFVEVEHHGFAGQTGEASRHFFRHYGLAEPNIPFLSPEFDNPLLLKLFCTAAKDSGQHELPANLVGVTAIFKFVLDKIDERLARLLDYYPGEQRVTKAVRRLAQLMAEQGSEFLPLDAVKRELELIHPSNGYSRSLLQHLIAEHVLVRLPVWGMNGEESEAVRFTYQRLSDHLIIQSLLTLTAKPDLHKLFAPQGTIGRRIHAGIGVKGIAGWLEALAIQLPERYGLEIDEVLVSPLTDKLVRRAFIASIVWRQPDAFSSSTGKRIKKLLAQDTPFDVLESVVAVAARPDHPYNADWLDQLLRPMSMARRDSLWSIFLYGKVTKENSVQRLIEWAWIERNESGFTDEVVRLAALTLAWCLTTSDRFVRDRATKALVAMLEQRVQVLRWILNHFRSVDEPYVRERLYAVAYGCAMRTRQADELRKLAQEVYDTVFRDGSPPPSVLLRDHAHGVLAAAVRGGLKLDYKQSLIVPPYRSTWPKMPPTLNRLQKLFHADKHEEAYWGTSRIFQSVTGDDFKHYVIGNVTYWSDSRDTPNQPGSPKRMYEKWLKEVRKDHAEILETYAKVLESLGDTEGYDRFNPRLQRTSRQLADTIQHLLPSILGKKEVVRFNKYVVPYLKQPYHRRYCGEFDLELFQRLILQRVLQLGYVNERFSEFDRRVPEEGRSSYKAERIGKKYQWIAYDELHARISDNFGRRHEKWPSISDGEWKDGTWPDSFRDIDPSLLLRKTSRVESSVNQRNWWTPHFYEAWNSAPTALQWLKTAEDLPPPTDFLALTGPDKKSHWMLLHGYTSWHRQNYTESFRDQRSDSHEVHYIFRSYLVAKKHLPEVMAWGEKQNWINELLRSPSHDFHRYLHEHFWSPHFDGRLEECWSEGDYGSSTTPHPICHTTSQYLCEAGNYDCSLDSTVLIDLPSPWLARKMGLRLLGRNGDFVDANGRLIAFDPSTRESGQGVMLMSRDALKSFLKREGLAIFWTLLGEKNIYPPEHLKGWPGRLTILGIYSWEGEEINGASRSEFIQGR